MSDTDTIHVEHYFPKGYEGEPWESIKTHVRRELEQERETSDALGKLNDDLQRALARALDEIAAVETMAREADAEVKELKRELNKLKGLTVKAADIWKRELAQANERAEYHQRKAGDVENQLQTELIAHAKTKTAGEALARKCSRNTRRHNARMRRRGRYFRTARKPLGHWKDKLMSMTTDEKCAVFRAWCEGKTIQTSDLNRQWWEDCENPGWFFESSLYRIKPEPPKPREWWLYRVPIEGSFAHSTVYLTPQPNAIHVREVLP